MRKLWIASVLALVVAGFAEAQVIIQPLPQTGLPACTAAWNVQPPSQTFNPIVGCFNWMAWGAPYHDLGGPHGCTQADCSLGTCAFFVCTRHPECSPDPTNCVAANGGSWYASPSWLIGCDGNSPPPQTCEASTPTVGCDLTLTLTKDDVGRAIYIQSPDAHGIVPSHLQLTILSGGGGRIPRLLIPGNPEQATTSLAFNIDTPPVGGPWNLKVTSTDLVTCSLHLLPIDDPATLGDTIVERYQRLFGEFLYWLARVPSMFSHEDPKDAAYFTYNAQKRHTDNLEIKWNNLIRQGKKDTSEGIAARNNFNMAESLLSELKQAFFDPADRINYADPVPLDTSLCPAPVAPDATLSAARAAASNAWDAEACLTAAYLRQAHLSVDRVQGALLEGDTAAAHARAVEADIAFANAKAHGLAEVAKRAAFAVAFPVTTYAAECLTDADGADVVADFAARGADRVVQEIVGLQIPGSCQPASTWPTNVAGTAARAEMTTAYQRFPSMPAITNALCWSGVCAPGAYTVNVTLASQFGGTGIVKSPTLSLSCGTICSTGVPPTSSLTITATADVGSTFSGWSGACTGTATTCTFTPGGSHAVTATFKKPSAVLTLTKLGNGTGRVISTPAGIDCASACTTASMTVALNQFVILNPGASPGSIFKGWTGACTGLGSCNLAVNANRTVTATFRQTYSITAAVATTFNGGGSVKSTTVGYQNWINCGATCTATFPDDTSIVLQATPVTGSTFAGWSGACTGTVTTCTVKPTGLHTATASFRGPSYTLTTIKAGTGTGTVTSSPAGISCPGDCTEVYAPSTHVTLTAEPAVGSLFTGWSGSCVGTNPVCALTMSAVKSTTATFRLPYTVTVTVVNNLGATSSVRSTAPAPANQILCPGTCSKAFPDSGNVTLAYTLSSGAHFVGWSGACTGTVSVCTITPTGNHSVTATFSK